MDGAIRAAQGLVALDANDGAAKGQLERLLGRAQRWPELAELLSSVAYDGTSPEQKGGALGRLVHVELERLRNFDNAIMALQMLVSVQPNAESITALQ